MQEFRVTPNTAHTRTCRWMQAGCDEFKHILFYLSTRRTGMF